MCWRRQAHESNPASMKPGSYSDSDDCQGHPVGSIQWPDCSHSAPGPATHSSTGSSTVRREAARQAPAEEEGVLLAARHAGDLARSKLRDRHGLRRTAAVAQPQLAVAVAAEGRHPGLRDGHRVEAPHADPSHPLQHSMQSSPIHPAGQIRPLTTECAVCGCSGFAAIATGHRNK